MSKVLVDKELLVKHVAEIDSWNASMERILGKQPSYKWQSLESLRAILARPAEAEAADVRKIVVDSLVGMIAGVTRMIPPTDQPLPDFIQAPVDRAVERISAALSAVTAERDRLREQVAALQSGANSWQSGYDKGREDGAKSAGGWKDQHARDSAELRRLRAERDQLRAEVERLRKALEQFADDGNWCYDTCNISRDVAKDALVAKDETP